MVINILNFRDSVIDTVCRFVAHRSLLRMREVSKTMKKFLDHSILTTQKTRVFIFKFEARKTVNAYRKLTVHFWDREHAIWSICLLMKLGYDGISKSDRTLEVILKPEAISDLLTYLGPLINRANYFRISFYDDQTEIIHSLSKFVSKNSVQFLHVHELRTKSSNFCMWFEFVKEINQMQVEYCIEQLTNKSLPRLTLLADHVEGMHVVVDKGFDDNPEEKEIEIVQAILSRKCYDLAFGVSFNNRKISACHAEKLLKFFHRMDKKVVFESTIDSHFMNAQIGTYNLNIRNRVQGLTNCSIRHIDVNEYA